MFSEAMGVTEKVFGRQDVKQISKFNEAHEIVLLRAHAVRPEARREQSAHRF